MADSDYEHWGDDSEAPASIKSSKAASTRFTSYNGKNGRRAYEYHAANGEKKESKSVSVEIKPVEEVCAPPVVCEETPAAAPDPPSAAAPNPIPGPAAPPQQQPQPVYYMMSGYPPMQYAAYPQQVAGLPPGYYPYPQMGLPCNAFMYQPNTAAAASVEVKTEEKKDAGPKVKKWQGRTKAEVEEDNMKIAMREGVCAPRKVMPKDLEDDQLVWCVEVDGSHTLRTYATVKEFVGEWKADPRFLDSWYFVREEERRD